MLQSLNTLSSIGLNKEQIEALEKAIADGDEWLVYVVTEEVKARHLQFSNKGGKASGECSMCTSCKQSASASNTGTDALEARGSAFDW